MSGTEPAGPEGIERSGLPGPYPVGEYAAQLKKRLNEFAHVQLHGEVANLRTSRVRVYFELRDARGAVPCSMWLNRFETLGLTQNLFAEGAQVVVAGGCDYYPGTATASPSFSFAVHDLRIAGAGDLLAQIDRLRKRLDMEGLLLPQKNLPRVGLPRVIGVVTGETGKARDDVLAGLRRRGWGGRLVWAYAPVQDRHAAPRIGRALQDLAATGDVDVIIVARGGGSPTDLMAFSDETLCRTVALLPVPVIASVGHHTDSNVIDDVAAQSCSTPTHAAETAVPINPLEARATLTATTGRMRAHSRTAVLVRARGLAQLAREPARQVARHRRDLHQRLREMRASATRRVAEDRIRVGRRALVLSRGGGRALVAHARAHEDLRVRTTELARAAPATAERRAKDLERLAALLGAHDPARALERGYALVEDASGDLVTTADEARAAKRVTLRFADDAVGARIEEEPRHD